MSLFNSPMSYISEIELAVLSVFYHRLERTIICDWSLNRTVRVVYRLYAIGAAPCVVGSNNLDQSTTFIRGS